MLLLALPAAAQLTVGDNLKMNLNGVVTVDYNGTYGNMVQASHGLNFGGSGTLSGYYYDPNFLSFNLSPFYGRSQQNSQFQSIFDSSGLEFSSNIFAGSHFPGSVGYSKSWNSEGNFGIPGTPNYTTVGSGQGFSIGWGAYVPNFPSLLATFNTGSSDYSVFGTDLNGSNSNKNFLLRSNYMLAGFNLNASYNLGTAHSEIPEVIGNQTLQTIDSNNNSFQVGASHNLPMHGSASANYSHSYVDSNYLGYSFNGTIDQVNAAAGINPTQKLSFSASMGYTNNLTGSLYQSIIPGSGVSGQATGVQTGTGVSQATVVGPYQQTEASSNAFYIEGYGAYAVAPNLQLNFQVQRRQQTYLGATYGANTYGAGAVYTHGFLGGFFNTSLNVAANTSDTISGNTVSFTTNVGYNRTFADWFTSVNFSYAQNVQSFLVSYTNSFYLYSGNVRHRFGRVVWTASAAGSHSAITNQPNTGNGAQSYSTSIGGYRLTAAAAYTQSNGYGLLGSGGIVPPPNLPPGVIPPEWIILYGGNSYSFAVGGSPFRHLSLGANYSKAHSNTTANLIYSANYNEQINFIMNYQLRKITVTGGWGRLVQQFSASGLPASDLNSYYFGISRYFNFF